MKNYNLKDYVKGIKKVSKISNSGETIEGYFLECDWRKRKALYFPDYLVVVEAEDPYDDFFQTERPENVLSFNYLDWDKTKEDLLYIEEIPYELVRTVSIPKKNLKKLKKCSFNSIAEHMLALNLFLSIKKEINQKI